MILKFTKKQGFTFVSRKYTLGKTTEGLKLNPQPN